MAELNEQQHIKLLNFLLDELPSHERQVFEEELNQNPMLKEELFKLQQTMGLVETSLKAETLPTLSEDTLNKIDEKIYGKKSSFDFSWIWKNPRVYGGLAVACVALFIFNLFYDPAILPLKDIPLPAPLAEKHFDDAEEADMEMAEDMADEVTADSTEVADIVAEPAEELKGESAPTEITMEDSDEGELSTSDKTVYNELFSSPVFVSGDADDFANIEDLAPKDDTGKSEWMVGYPRRVAMKVMTKGLKGKLTAKTLEENTSQFMDCFDKGYFNQAFLQIRTFVNPQGQVTSIDTIKANKMPLKNRACLTHVFEKTQFSKTLKGGSFVLTLRLFESIK